MAIILNIDTATEHASVCISNNAQVSAFAESTEQKNHASFVQPAIQQILAEAGINLNELDAVAVTAGPGSYTGLRVGMASAKGICYVLEKPLILVNTLEVMAYAALQENSQKDVLFCPMIDARRMEVFTALYNSVLEPIEEPHALVLEPGSFSSLLQNHSVVFSGNGAAKLKELVTGSSNAYFSEVKHSAVHLAPRALEQFRAGKFADLAYSEPLYVKEFFNPVKKSK